MDTHFNLDSKSPISLYYQVEMEIRRQIETNEFKVGEFLPHEQELSEVFNVSKITIRKALSRLEEEGLIRKRRGERSLVISKPIDELSVTTFSEDFRVIEDELRQQGFSPKALVLEHTKLKDHEFAKSIFHYEQHKELVRIRRVGLVNEKPIWMESRYFPPDIGKVITVDKLETQSVQSILRELGIVVDSVIIQLQAVKANPQQSSVLKLPNDYPLLLHQSVSLDAAKRVIQLNRVYLHSSYYRLILSAKPKPGLPGLDIFGGGYSVNPE